MEYIYITRWFWVYKTADLIHDISADIIRFKLIMPNIKIVWSDILMRRYWHNTRDGRAVERSRNRVNLAVKNAVLKEGFCVIRHPNIRSTEIFSSLTVIRFFLLNKCKLGIGLNNSSFFDLLCLSCFFKERRGIILWARWDTLKWRGLARFGGHDSFRYFTSDHIR